MPANFGIPKGPAMLSALKGVSDSISSGTIQLVNSITTPLGNQMTANDAVLDHATVTIKKHLKKKVTDHKRHLESPLVALHQPLIATATQNQEDLNNCLTCNQVPVPVEEENCEDNPGLAGCNTFTAPPGQLLQTDAGIPAPTPSPVLTTGSGPVQQTCPVAPVNTCDILPPIEIPTPRAFLTSGGMPPTPTEQPPPQGIVAGAIQDVTNIFNTIQQQVPLPVQQMILNDYTPVTNSIVFDPNVNINVTVSDRPNPHPPVSQTGSGVPTPITITIQNTGLSGFPCPTFSTGAAGLPLPGSPAFIATADSFGTALGSIVSAITDWTSKATNTAVWYNWLVAIYNAQPSPSIGVNPIKSFVGLLLQLLKPDDNPIQYILDALTCAANMAVAVMPSCNRPAMMGITVLRSLIHSIEKLEVGTDAGAWIVLAVGVKLDIVSEYLDALEQYYCPMEIPSIAEVKEAWVRNYIDSPTMQGMLRCNGADYGTFSPYVLAAGERISPDEAIQFVRRNGGSKADELTALRSCGVLDPLIANAIDTLYDELPTIQDHLHWLQRNVFDSAYVAQYQLLDGFEEKFWPAFGQDLLALGMQEKYAQLHYAAHWIQPSPTQMHEFVYRLRPGAAGVTTPFTVTDFKNLLGEQDVSPLAREWFAQTLYHIPALSYIRDMYRANIINDAQLQSYHQDLGYSLPDSENFVAVDKIQKARYRASGSGGWNPAALRKAYISGFLSAQQVTDQMLTLGWTAEEAQALMDRAAADNQYRIIQRAKSKVLSRTVSQVSQALKVGVIDAGQAVQSLVGIGWTEDQSTAIVNLELATANVGRVQSAISALKGAFLQGEVDEAYCRTQLANLGVTSDASDSYVAVWKISLTAGRKRRTAKEIVNDVAEGMLDVSDAAARLLNLGYTESDAMLYLADVRQQIVTTEAEAKAAGVMGGEYQSIALGDLAVESLGLSKRLVADLMKHEPPVKLSKWLKHGIVDEEYVRQRLSLYGWSPLNIDKWVEGAQLEK